MVAEQDQRSIRPSIHPDTEIGKVFLTVSSLDQSKNFYTRALGLQVRSMSDGLLELGTGRDTLLQLRELPGARLLAGHTGLYHYALLVPSRLDLANVLQNLLQQQVPLTGFADHHVSEAIYLPDPDGHGIEIYRDRPRRDWSDSQGQFYMTTDPLDVEGLLAELNNGRSNRPWEGLPGETTMGHVHLHVHDIQQALFFYNEVLGFDLMLHWNSAAFLSAGGYHHHLGINIWAGKGASPPPPDSLRLLAYQIRLPDESAFQAVLDRLEAAGVDFERGNSQVRVQDPSGNELLLVVKSQSTIGA